MNMVRTDDMKCHERLHRVTQRLKKIASDFKGKFEGPSSKSPYGFCLFYTIPTKEYVQVVLGGWMEPRQEVRRLAYETLRQINGYKTFAFPKTSRPANLRASAAFPVKPKYYFLRDMARQATSHLKRSFMGWINALSGREAGGSPAAAHDPSTTGSAQEMGSPPVETRRAVTEPRTVGVESPGVGPGITAFNRDGPLTPAPDSAVCVRDLLCNGGIYSKEFPTFIKQNGRTCGCGGSCEAARKHFSYPDSLPLIDFSHRKYSISNTMAETLITWASDSFPGFAKFYQGYVDFPCAFPLFLE
ncbi:hypothetical protein Vretimale_2950 [Volvox reticuliferus]|uniref:Uncharacterized protein n=3 Tax=Volvox reticuliferus TaxID=1737510 RepID=A0A8J4D8H4_9CHLO|nr:hypothetical protein Vretimale_2950 [Volvox reticuliferus]